MDARGKAQTWDRYRWTVQAVLDHLGICGISGRMPCPLCGSKGRNPFAFRDYHWVCFSCGKKGSPFDLVMEVQGCSFREALSALGLASTSPARGIASPPTSPSDPLVQRKLAYWSEQRQDLLQTLSHLSASTRKLHSWSDHVAREGRPLIARKLAMAAIDDIDAAMESDLLEIDALRRSESVDEQHVVLSFFTRQKLLEAETYLSRLNRSRNLTQGARQRIP